MKPWLVGIFLLGLILAGCRGQVDSSGGGGAEPVLQAALPTQAPLPTHSEGIRLPLPLVLNPAPAEPDLSQTPAVLPAPAPTAASTFKLCSPLVDTPTGELALIVSEPYHPPPAGREERHHGVDFAYYHRYGRDSIAGAGVQTVLAGQVAASLVDRFPYGNALIIETPEVWLPADIAARIHIPADQSLYILFAHLQEPPQAALNERVDACQAVGSAGRSGNAGGAHLHMEARIGPSGERFDSMAYYIVKASDLERENYLRWRISGDFQHFDPMALFIPPEQ